MAKQKGLTAMTKEESIRLALEKNKGLVKQVQELQKKNPALHIRDACKQLNWSFGAYYSTLKKLGKSPRLAKPGMNTKKINYPNARKPAMRKLKVTQIIAAPTHSKQVFMLVGDPMVLAAFARAYEQA